MGMLSKQPNIGKVLEEQLHEAGIDTIEQLRETGSRAAWLRIRSFDPSACINRLCALEGAIQGIRWHDLDPETRTGLREFYNRYKEPKSR